jgi:AraC family transcriptional regulator of arabinose operon
MAASPEIPVETPHLTVLRLLTGHFRETSGYRAYRRNGVDDWLLIHTVAGQGRFGFGTGEIVARPGDWVLLQPGAMHDYGVEPELRQWELLWAHFQPRDSWRPWLRWPAVNGGLMRLSLADAPGAAAIADRFFEAHRLLDGAFRQREELAMNALEDVILRCNEHNPLAAQAPGDARIERARNFMARTFERRIALRDIASEAGLSSSRLSHLFREETGQTPLQYLETLRMQRAAELLLRTGFSVKQIAGAVGFESAFYFSLRFKAWTRLSPTQFRAERGPDAAGVMRKSRETARRGVQADFLSS